MYIKLNVLLIHGEKEAVSARTHLFRVVPLRLVDAAQLVVVDAGLGHFLPQQHRPLADTSLLFQPRLEDWPQGALRAEGEEGRSYKD